MKNRKISKSNLDLAKEIRCAWSINPRTRVHDNNLKNNKKKQRFLGKTLCRENEKAYHYKRPEDNYSDLYFLNLLLNQA